MTSNDPNEIPFRPAGASNPGILLSDKGNQTCKFPQHPPSTARRSPSRLMSAIRTGDIETVKLLLDLYNPPYTKLHWEAYNFLCESLLNEEEDIAKLLLERGANANEARNGLKTPLHHAVEKGYTEVVSMLLEKGAFVNAKDDRNETSLHRAVEKGNLQIIELLLNKKADIEAKTKDGMTPLHLAVKLLGRAQTSEDNLDHAIASRCKLCIPDVEMRICRDAVPLVHRPTRTMDATDATKTDTSLEEVAKLLLNRGADVDARNAEGKTVLRIAVEQCNFGIIERILLSRPAVNGSLKDQCLRIALQSAGLEYRGIVELLVRYGFTLKDKHANHRGLVHIAVIKGYTGTVDDLLKQGADVDGTHTIANGGTLLHSATASGRFGIAELLLERGANVNARDKKDKTPIVYAVENMNPDMTELFLNNGVNAEGTPGLLHTAAERGCSHIMEMILEKIPGIDVNTVDNVASRSLRFVNIDPSDSDGGKRVNAKKSYELTALHVAVAGGFARGVELLLEHSANIDFLAEKVGTPLHCSVLQRDEAIMEMLLLKGADVDARRDDGTTPLHLAVREGNANAFELLIKHGADVHKRNNEGLNLVHMATEHDHLKMFEKDLLDVFKAGDPKTNDGLTALHVAVRMGSLENVQILLRHGADASVQDKNGVTPLHVAVSRDHEGSVIEALLISLGNVDTADLHGHTALHKAADEMNVAAVRLLLLHGSDVNVKDKFGYTPLRSMTNVARFRNRLLLRQITGNYCNMALLITMFEKHIVKITALGLHVDSDNSDYVKVSSHHKLFYDGCMREIESMKRTKIGECKVSYYEFLTTDNRQLAFYSRNRSIAEGLKRGDLTCRFRFYRDMIHLRFKKMKIINDLIDPSSRALSALSGHCLSDYDYMEIVSYLDIRDLQNVIKAGASDEKSQKIRDLIRVSNP